MTRQNLATGTYANDGSGDTLRQAGQKINENFIELYQKLGGDSNVLTGEISVTGNGLAFEGVTADGYEPRLKAVDPTLDHTINLPNASGNIVLDTNTQTLTNKTLTSPILSLVKIQDLDASHTYDIIAGSLSANQNLNLPSLTDSDTFVFADASQTLTNKTLTSPALNTPAIIASLNDVNGAEIFGVSPEANAVNHIDVHNAAAGGHPKLAAHGDDTNINIVIEGKGTGSVNLKKASYTSSEITSAGNASTSHTFIICNSGTALAVGMANGTIVGENKIFTNKGAGTATITPTTFGPGTSISLAQHQGCQMIWDGLNWQLIGNYGGTVS